MKDEDQAVRAEWSGGVHGDSSFLSKIEEVSTRHLARMKEIVEAHGWPGKSLVGEDGAHAAWLLAQHADGDPGFQKRCLALMEPGVALGEVRSLEVAYLTDRILIREGRPQRYGTQHRWENGAMVPFPIEEEADVDRRRREAGLSPLAEYSRRLNERSGE